jgi:hypothetical protein
LYPGIFYFRGVRIGAGSDLLNAALPRSGRKQRIRRKILIPRAILLQDISCGHAGNGEAGSVLVGADGQTARSSRVIDKLQAIIIAAAICINVVIRYAAARIVIANKITEPQVNVRILRAGEAERGGKDHTGILFVQAAGKGDLIERVLQGRFRDIAVAVKLHDAFKRILPHISIGILCCITICIILIKPIFIESGRSIGIHQNNPGMSEPGQRAAAST